MDNQKFSPRRSSRELFKLLERTKKLIDRMEYGTTKLDSAVQAIGQTIRVQDYYIGLERERRAQRRSR